MEFIDSGFVTPYHHTDVHMYDRFTQGFAQGIFVGMIVCYLCMYMHRRYGYLLLQ
jgi:hypothetical protein